jgi:hypothetical protein
MQEKAGRHSGKGSVPKVQEGRPREEGRLHGAPAAGAWAGQPRGAPPAPLLALDVPTPVLDVCAVELVPAPPAPAELLSSVETTPLQWRSRAAGTKAKR